jgi:hypothetical protein
MAGASAILVGGAPGTAQVFAEMPKPGGGTRAVELSVCVDPAAAPNDDSCPRIPLTIRVVLWPIRSFGPSPPMRP